MSGVAQRYDTPYNENLLVFPTSAAVRPSSYCLGKILRYMIWPEMIKQKVKIERTMLDKTKHVECRPWVYRRDVQCAPGLRGVSAAAVPAGRDKSSGVSIPWDP